MNIFDGIKTDVKIVGKIEIDVKITQQQWDNMTVSMRRDALRLALALKGEP